MLTFTGSGVVSAPTALQVRMGTQHPGRVRAGAPLPSRRMTDAEVLLNARWFTEGMRGPRTRPCTTLVLSGVDADRYATLSGLVASARDLGIEHVVLHAGTQVPPVHIPGVDALVLTAVSPPVLPEPKVPVTWIVEAVRGQMGRVEATASALLRQPGGRVVLTWPFPPLGRPAPPHEVQAALVRLARLSERAGSTLHLRGLPPCLVRGVDTRPRRAQNRWYVDASHQCGRALLFFPDVLRFTKADSCRFCKLDARCDGVAAPLGAQADVRLVPFT